jgi:electron transfer flavoprotein beta subunit
MNIIVCVKQVPEIALVTVDEGQGQVKLPQGPGIINPLDSYAIEEALRLREAQSGTVTAISLGGKESELALREALALGADQAVRLSDDSFAGIDAIGIAAVLAAGIRKIGEYDLVIFGKQAVDSDDAGIHAAVGGFLALPAAMFVRKIESAVDGKLVVERMTDSGADRVSMPLPAVISVVKEINEPRLPSLKGKMMAKKKPIQAYGAADLDLSAHQKLLSDASQVAKAANPPARQKGEMISGDTPEEIADNLFVKLRKGQII